VIAYSAEGRTATGFAIARFSRIYPTFVFCMTLTCLAIVFLGPPHFETSFRQWTANLFIAATAFRQPYMDASYWSLVIEVMFYAWVAVFIAAGCSRPDRHHHPIWQHHLRQ
jgi:peptidoglycan/LPS O-acetylase OafA/YrhL